MGFITKPGALSHDEEGGGMSHDSVACDLRCARGSAELGSDGGATFDLVCQSWLGFVFLDFRLLTNIHSLKGFGGSFTASIRRSWRVRGADNGRTGGGFVSNTTTFKANGGYSLILYGLCQGSYLDFGDER